MVSMIFDVIDVDSWQNGTCQHDVSDNLMQNYDKLDDCFYLGQPLLSAGREHEAGDKDGDEEEKTVHDPRCR